MVFHRLSAVFVFCIFLLFGCQQYNLTYIFESDIRFEHCVALDFNNKIHDGHRLRCWINWIYYYSYNQDYKVQYAYDRINEIYHRNLKWLKAPPYIEDALSYRSKCLDKINFREKVKKSLNLFKT